MAQISFNLDQETYDEIKTAAHESGRSMKKYLIALHKMSLDQGDSDQVNLKKLLKISEDILVRLDQS